MTVDDDHFESLLDQVRDLHRRADELTRSHARLNDHIHARLSWRRDAPPLPPEQRRLADEVIELLQTPKLSSPQSRRLQQIFFGR